MQEIPEFRKMLSRWKRFLFHQKYRFDLGHQSLAMMNFALLIIAASDKLRYYTNIPRTWILLVVAVPLGFIVVWLVGLFLDKVVRYSQAYSLVAVKRNPIWTDHLAQMERVEKKLDLLLEKT